jgi:hypothetical protein
MSTGQKKFFLRCFFEVSGTESGQEVKRRRRVSLIYPAVWEADIRELPGVCTPGRFVFF